MRLILILSLIVGGAIGNGCASKKLMKNCEHKGSQIFECEDL